MSKNQISFSREIIKAGAAIIKPIIEINIPLYTPESVKQGILSLFAIDYLEKFFNDFIKNNLYKNKLNDSNKLADCVEAFDDPLGVNSAKVTPLFSDEIQTTKKDEKLEFVIGAISHSDNTDNNSNLSILNITANDKINQLTGYITSDQLNIMINDLLSLPFAITSKYINSHIMLFLIATSAHLLVAIGRKLGSGQIDNIIEAEVNTLHERIYKKFTAANETMNGNTIVSIYYEPETRMINGNIEICNDFIAEILEW